MKRKKWLKVVWIVTAVMVGVAGIFGSIINSRKDDLLKKALEQLNGSFSGRLAVEDTRISPFQNFPYISIDLKNVQIFETKTNGTTPIVRVKDAYIGFDLFSIISGTYEVKRIKLKEGYVKLVQYRDNSLNIANAFSGRMSDSSTSSDETVNLSLKGIELIDIDLLKLNEENNILVEAFIENATSTFKATEAYTKASLTTNFVFNLIVEGDTSFLKNKQVKLETALDFDPTTNVLELSPSELLIEQALFLMEGAIDIDDDMDLDLSFKGQKQNFDLFLAFLPPELSPLASRYENGGTIYFDANVVGPSIGGNLPKIDVDFGCSQAYVHNLEAEKEINDLSFKGHFTTGVKNDPNSMVLTIQDFSAKPETGSFGANVTVRNFESPDINVQLNSDFNLAFLADFLNIDDLENVSGNVSLKMNFRDIIDLDQPEKTIEQLNESYFTELEVKDLNFTSPTYPLPFENINISAKMDGHEARIEQFRLNMGNSDIDIKASISDLPAIIHHTDIPVEVDLDIRSSLLDLHELTMSLDDSTSFNEQIKDFNTRFKFNSTARAFTESPSLPIGEFFIERLNAQFTNYPHRLHDFYVDVLIDSTDFKVVDFNGMIDESDFHFDGKLTNYGLWFEDEPKGTTTVDFDFNSSKLQLKDLFTYGGENYVPEDYRQEEFENLVVKGTSTLNFNRKLQSANLTMNDVQAYLKAHDMYFDDFNGQFYVDSSRIEISDFGGRLGNSQFKTDFVYYKKDTSQVHSFSLESRQLDFDQLFSYQPPVSGEEDTPKNHEEAFNLFELPFANLRFAFNIDRMNYHRYLLDGFTLKGRMQPNHIVHIDTMSFHTAGGHVALNGYFNGSNPEMIYFSPSMNLENVDLEQLLFKFENFGQDQLVSENLSGRLSANVSGRIHMHPDMIPGIEDSELHIGMEVVDGSLKNFAAFEALSSFFTDKNLSMIRFDTLRNEFHLKNSVLDIPTMNINTTLGYFELSGSQNMHQEMEYYVRIPWKVVARAGAQKIFGNKNRDNSDQVDEIQYRDETKRTRFVNVRITGTPDDYDISLSKRKDRDGT